MTRACTREGATCDASAEPIVCTLGVADQEGRAGDFRAVFEHLVATNAFEGGFRWTFRPSPGLEERLVALAEREHACCRFFEFTIFSEGHTLVWETRAREDAAVVMKELMRLPLALEAAGDLASLKRVFVDAGVSFAADDERP